MIARIADWWWRKKLRSLIWEGFGGTPSPSLEERMFNQYRKTHKPIEAYREEFQ